MQCSLVTSCFGLTCSWLQVMSILCKDRLTRDDRVLVERELPVGKTVTRDTCAKTNRFDSYDYAQDD